MTTVLEKNNSFINALTKTPGHAREWVNEVRRAGAAEFTAHGFPTTQEEEWRTTSVAAIAKTEFVPALVTTGQAAIDAAGALTFGTEACAELVFIDGHFDAHLSTLSGLPRGVKVASLEQAFETEGALLEKHLGKYADVRKNPFVALNTGFVREGAVVQIGRGITVERPIHLLFISLPSTQASATYPRVLVIAEENSESTVVETYAGNGSGAYLTNAVTEIVLADHARMDHCKVQQEGAGAYHVAAMEVVLNTAATFISHSASVGSKLTRNDLNVTMNGERADATLNGLVLIGGEQHVDNHTLLRHEKANCPSHELYKYVLADRSTGVFRGKIFVQQDAQKTDSKQTSKCLLLSDAAYMNSQPALEIYADDVKCTHGSTTGPVDEEAVFYLRSRGVSLAQARHLMTYAFAADVTRRIRVGPVRRRLEDLMAAQHGLPQDLRITNLGSHDEKAR